MKIDLYTNEKIFTFTLPNMMQGIYKFDMDKEQPYKLINIEARDNNWVLYSTPYVNVLEGNAPILETVISPGKYYFLKREDKIYLIRVSNLYDDSIKYFAYSGNLEFNISNNKNSSIVINNPLITSDVGKVYVENNNIVFENSKKIPVYLNNLIINDKKSIVRFGDYLDIYGFKIYFLYNMVIMNNPNSSIYVYEDRCNLKVANLPKPTEPRDLDVIDSDLYTKDDYFSKSPRLRRKIEEKEITLSPPPGRTENTEPPLLLVLAPMLTMAAVSFANTLNTFAKLSRGETTWAQSWPTILSGVAMLLSSLLWPLLTRLFNKFVQFQRNIMITHKYGKYLNVKRKELNLERNLQKEILLENLIPLREIIEIINNGKLTFWDKRVEQDDFLTVRIGTGNEKMQVKINYPEDGFTIDDDKLKKDADKLINEYKYIEEVPIGYSFYTGKITGILGNSYKKYPFINNVLLQLLAYYTYEDLKIVVFTNETLKNHWDYLKYTNHNFSNDKEIRFFASDIEEAKRLNEYLNFEYQKKVASHSDEGPKSPYYLVIIDDFSMVKNLNVIKNVCEDKDNNDFSLIILEEQMSRLPSKCDNFILLGDNDSNLLKNSFENQENIKFKDEVEPYIDMMWVARKVSNVPIEFEGEAGMLPNSLTFLEMENVSKTSGLNIMSRWQSNDSTISLKTEVGVDSDGNLMYLDLHEKYHGPHGLIAGMTGSGKSEFIITYVLSLAMNYCPNDVAFILIDYKGGGLAYAFENKATGVKLPHLAGTITNLDKSELDRTLISIDSEIKRRQRVFNEARDALGESTIDIYKYQKFFKEGRLQEPVPHLFIICDEFAELKSQQPDFMDDLISVARIGRSLGVHLILATQKPSGVVNDQIWSNTKFRVCLKVQTAEDSNEMLKKPDAALLKQTGRFYLQVGYDEYFAMGQSAWCGAKYYPSDLVVKEVDKSIQFINDVGVSLKSIQAGKSVKVTADGEQLKAIMTEIINTANILHVSAKRLWLDSIPENILIDNLNQKYDYHPDNDLSVIIGEFDAPESQSIGVLKYSLIKNGNTIIYGNDEEEREKLLRIICYGFLTNYRTNKFNLYGIDFGSESLRIFESFNQVGGFVYAGEEEKENNLLKMINLEIKKRKKLLIPYGGLIDKYNEATGNSLSNILFVINNFDAVIEENDSLVDELITITRECQRYGIYVILVCNNTNVVSRRLSMNFLTRYALHLTDSNDYYNIFNVPVKIEPKAFVGRGIVFEEVAHEFQTASIESTNEVWTSKVSKIVDIVNGNNKEKAPSIPTLPDKVALDLITKFIKFPKLPVGIIRDSLKIAKLDFNVSKSLTISSNRIEYTVNFVESLAELALHIDNVQPVFFDLENIIPNLDKKEYNGKKLIYYRDSFNELITKLDEFVNALTDGTKYLFIFYGLSKLKNIINPVSNLEKFIESSVKNENVYMLIIDAAKNLKSIEYDSFYGKIKNNTDGLWIGRGIQDQSVFRINKIVKEKSSEDIDYGYIISDGDCSKVKLISFSDFKIEDDDNE